MIRWKAQVTRIGEYRIIQYGDRLVHEHKINSAFFYHLRPVVVPEIPATGALTGTAENQIRQIITQKYIAGFFHCSDFNAWYENRRTGYPAFTLNQSTNLNTPATAFPLRWQYPQKELDYNGVNFNNALKAQYNGNDDQNQAMWLLQ